MTDSDPIGRLDTDLGEDVWNLGSEDHDAIDAAIQAVLADVLTPQALAAVDFATEDLVKAMERIVLNTVNAVLRDLRWRVFVYEGGEIEIEIYSELAQAIKSAMLTDLLELAKGGPTELLP